MSLAEEPEAWLEREDQQHILEGSCSIGRATLNTLVVDFCKSFAAACGFVLSRPTFDQ